MSRLTLSQRLSLVFAVLLIAGFVLLAATAGAQEKVVNVYNWAEYIGENTVRAFERPQTDAVVLEEEAR